MERHPPADPAELFISFNCFFTAFREYCHSRISYALKQKSSSYFPVQCRLTWVTFKQWFRQSCQICMKVRMSIWWFCPQNTLCVQSQCRAIYVITHHTATVGHSAEYLPFLQSPEFCPVSLLEKPGVGPSHATQTHTFWGSPISLWANKATMCRSELSCSYLCHYVRLIWAC